MSLQLNLARKMKCRTLAVERILGKTAKDRDGDKQRSELRVIDKFEMKLFFLHSAAGRIGSGNEQAQIKRNHGRSRAEFASDSGEMIAGNRADGAADVYDFRRSEVG